jgi:ankyrin repeat protein
MTRFLLARLYVDSLLDKRTKQRVLSTLDSLSKGSEKLDEAYRKAIERIDGQLRDDALLAKRALSWISYAQRPLTANELCLALAIEPDDKKLNADNIYQVEDIISVCAGLVIVDTESSIIRLIHFTTQEYFERMRSKWNPRALEDIATACLTYLSFDTFRSGICDSKEAWEVRITENEFLQYSARHWSDHTRPVQKIVSHLALAFLYDLKLVESTLQAASAEDFKFGYFSFFLRRNTTCTGLHLTARYGLLLLTEELLHGDNCKVEADSRDHNGITPLSYAASQGYHAVARLLVARDDVEANSKDHNGMTPLSYAVREGHDAVARLLLARDDIEANSQDYYGMTPLSYAALYGHEAVVRLLLARDDVEANSKDNNDQTPLSYAAKEGHEAVVRLLLAKENVEVDSKDNNDQTPLSYAAVYGHEAVVRLLLARDDVDADSNDKLNRTPLILAALAGHEEIVRLLIARDDVAVDSKDSNNETALSYAVLAGDKAVVRLIQSLTAA